MTERRCSILVISGFILNILSTQVGGFKILALDLYLSNVAFIAFAALYPLDRTRKTVGVLWYLALGAILHGTVFLGLKHEPEISGWSGFAISLIVLSIYLVLNHLALKKSKPLQQTSGIRFGYESIAILALFSALTIIVFRVLDAVLVDIPNEQRSILLFGVEFHHINFGIMLLLAVDMFGYARRQGKYMVALIMAGIGLGMLIDQSVYFALMHITDESYRSQESLWGAIIVYILCTGVWFWRAAK